jgi:hypothetical protein
MTHTQGGACLRMCLRMRMCMCMAVAVTVGGTGTRRRGWGLWVVDSGGPKAGHGAGAADATRQPPRSSQADVSYCFKLAMHTYQTAPDSLPGALRGASEAVAPSAFVAASASSAADAAAAPEPSPAPIVAGADAVSAAASKAAAVGCVKAGPTASAAVITTRRATASACPAAPSPDPPALASACAATAAEPDTAEPIACGSAAAVLAHRAAASSSRAAARRYSRGRLPQRRPPATAIRPARRHPLTGHAMLGFAVKAGCYLAELDPLSNGRQREWFSASSRSRFLASRQPGCAAQLSLSMCITYARHGATGPLGPVFAVAWLASPLGPVFAGPSRARRCKRPIWTVAACTPASCAASGLFVQKAQGNMRQEGLCSCSRGNAGAGCAGEVP